MDVCITLCCVDCVLSFSTDADVEDPGRRCIVRPPVTYTEGIPERNTLRIHSVYVQGVPH